MFILGFTTIFTNVHYLTIRQEMTPNHVLGRVAGASSMIMKIAAPLSFVSGGLIGEYYPVHYVFVISCIVIGIVLVIGMKSKIVKIK